MYLTIDGNRLQAQMGQSLLDLIRSAGMDAENVLEVLDAVEEEMPQKEIVRLSGKEDIALTKEQDTHKSLIGYAFAIITLGFLFCGVCVAYTVIELPINSDVNIGDFVFIDDGKTTSQMYVLNEKGDIQMALEGGERIFSRKSTKEMIRLAKRAK